MNRSIMIVICDFLVLCALSLSSGLNDLQNTVNPNVPGFPDHVVTVPEVKSVALEEYQRVLQKAEELKNELARLGGVDEKNRSIAVELDEHRTKLTESERKLGELSAKLFKSEQELKQAAASLIKAREQTAEKTEKLKEAGQRVEDLTKAMEDSRKRVESLEKITFVHIEDSRKKQQELDRSAKILNDREKELRKREQELNIAAVRIGKLETELKGRNRDLDSTRNELKNVQAEMKQKQRNLEYVQGRLLKKNLENESLKRNLTNVEKQRDEAENKLRSNSLEKYASSVARLDFSITNQRPVVGENVFSSVMYLPEVQIQGKIFLPSSLLAVTGLDRNFSGFTRITALNYEVRSVTGKGKAAAVSGALLAPDSLPGVCLIPMKQTSVAPLKILNRKSLKKRGLRNLTLFKAGSHGKATAELAERCSFNDLEGGNALLIRNSLRRGSELAAEPGDFIISKEGEFVGVITGISGEKNGFRLAKCTLFPEDFSLKGKTLELTKTPGSSEYRQFAETAEELRTRMRKTDPEYK